jgi:hypothetical protein
VLRLSTSWQCRRSTLPPMQQTHPEGAAAVWEVWKVHTSAACPVRRPTTALGGASREEEGEEVCVWSMLQPVGRLYVGAYICKHQALYIRPGACTPFAPSIKEAGSCQKCVCVRARRPTTALGGGRRGRRRVFCIQIGRF